MPSRHIFWLCILLRMANAQGPQPCPENPIVLTGSDFDQFIYSPYDELKKYPPNTDCRFIVVARTLQRRIHINVIESQLEEPLFTDCKDYVSVRDGALPTSQEIIRWCGSVYPPALSSSGDSLYIHFHSGKIQARVNYPDPDLGYLDRAQSFEDTPRRMSLLTDKLAYIHACLEYSIFSDNIIQFRGFNLSFVDYEIPGCPPSWIRDVENRYCYRLFDSFTGYTFVDAQKVCNYEGANLLTIESSEEYDFIFNQYSASHTFPWIGYNDANKEGIFDPIDPNVPSWPDSFPSFKADHSDKDCIFLDWNIRERVAHTVADCRSRHSLICKKRQDGTTIPIQLSNTLIRYGFQTASFNYTLILIILIILIVMLIILWIIYQKCKRTNTVEAVNRSQRAPIVAETSRRTSEVKASKSTEISRSKSSSKTKATDAVKRIINAENQHPTPTAEAALQQTIREDNEGSLNGQAANRRDSDLAYNGSNSPRIRTNPNQPLPVEHDFNSSQELRHETRVQVSDTEHLEHHEVQQREADSEVQQINKEAGEDEPPTPRPEQPPDRSHLYMEKEDQTIKVIPKPPQQLVNNGATPLHSVLGPVGEPTFNREQTNVTGISSTRSRGTQLASQNFERPHVGPLDNISAISLDEFWTK